MTRAQAFGRYELLDRISAGGMAEVFRAREVNRGTVVALKRILPQVAEDEEFIAMLKDEANICSKLEHPHIARTLDFGSVDNEYYIAFEYVDGRDLRQIFDRAVKNGENIPLSNVLYIFARIGEGLSYAHHRKGDDGETISLVHRDVSPQNIIVSFRGDVKLIDFGIAKARGKITRTEAGTIKGKFGYMSPEQVQGVFIDHRADIFALGICLWEMLTGKRLFQAENELQVLDKVRHMVIAPPSEWNAEVSPDLDRIVHKALAREPNERYRSAKDFYRDINALPESTATRDEVADYMRRTFAQRQGEPSSPGQPAAPRQGEPTSPGQPPVASPTQERSMNRLDAGTPVGQKAPRQETFPMAAENKGSDLDIFEGLGRKSLGSGSPERASSVPPPPRSGVPSDMANVKRTLLGVAAPPLPPPPGASGVARQAPPPPPGRATLPPVVPPPAKPSSPPSTRELAAVPSAASTRPAPDGAKAGLEMDWDDEDETTHVFDKSESKIATASSNAESTSSPSSPRTSAPPPSAPKLAAPPPPPASASMRAQAPSQPPFRAAVPTSGVGTGLGSQPPFRTSAPPPPPSVGNTFARTSSVPPATPGPSSFSGSTAPMNMPGAVVNPAPHPSMAPMPSRPPVATSQPPHSMEATAVVRPQSGNKMGLFVGLGIAFTAVVAGAVFFLTTPRTGRVVVNVNDPKGAAIDRVEIFVDGKKWCDTTPCTIDPVAAGQHEIKVLADGYEVPAAKSIAVESRKEAQLSLALAPTATRGGTGVKVSGTQPGVKLFVDDREIGPLPIDVRDLTPGSHKIRLVGTDRYQPIEKNVTVAKDEMLDLGPQQLKVVKGKITVSLASAKESGAKVYIVSGTDRRELPMLPISVDIDTSKTWQLEAAKPGFMDYKQPVSFDDGQAEKMFAVSLDPKGTSAAAPPQAVAHEEPKAAAPTPPPAAQEPKPAPTPAAPKPQQAAAADNGGATTGDSFLDINSIPVSNVLLDGKPIGTTPKLHVSVAPGNHTVVFVNAEQGLKKSLQVSVGAGETKKAIARLRAE